MTEPFRPGAITLDARSVTGLGPYQPCNDAAARGRVVQIHVELVAIGLRLDQQGEPVFSPKLAGRLHEDAPRPDIGPGIEIDTVRAVVDDALRNRQIVDFEFVDPDIEVRQDWRVGIAGQKLWHTRKRGAPSSKLADVEPAREPCERTPVQLDPRNRQECALGVVEHDIVQDSLAVQVAIDPSDGEAQARRRCDCRNLFGDETLSDWRIDDDHRQYQRRQQDRERPAKPLCPAAFALALRGVALCVDLVVFGHQNAWPSPT